MRVMHILPGGEFGGAEVQVLTVCQGLLERGIATRIAVFYEAEFAARARKLGAEVVLLTGGDPWRDMRAIRADARQWQPTIIHTHGVRGSVAGRIAGKLLGIPVVTSIHSDLRYDYASPIKRKLFMQMEARTRHLSQRVIATSAALYAVLRQRGYPAEQLVQIDNGMDVARAERLLAEARQHPTGIRAQLGITQASRVIVCVARLHPVKRHDVLIDAVALMPEDIHGAPVHLLLVGDGAMRTDIEARVAQYGRRLAHRVHLLGARDDVMAILCESDLFALTSQMEGMPLSVLEAMLAGLPVAVSKVGGMADLVTPECGLLVPVGNPQTLAQGLERILSDELLCRRMGQKGRERVLAHYSLERLHAQMADFYARVADEDDRS